MITEAEAISIAKNAIRGKVTPQEDAPIETELENERYVVTFVHVNPPDTLGPDFDAQVTIDANSGEVLNIIGGP